jgi:nucleolar complex protein 2
MVKKATKKFLKKGLSAKVKEQRKKNAWRNELNAKRKANPNRTRIDDEDVNNKDENIQVDTLRPREELLAADAALADLSADQFLSGGFKHHLLEKNDDDDHDDDDGNEENDENIDNYDDGVADDVADDHADAADDDDNADVDAADAKVTSDFQEHKRQLAALRQKDPKFFKFLQANDNALLDFELPDPVADTKKPNRKQQQGGDDADDDLREDELDDTPRIVAQGDKPTLTVAMVRRWSVAAFGTTEPLSAVSKLVSAFKAAALVNADGAGVEAARFKINSPQAFDELVAFCLDRLDAAFVHILDLRDPAHAKRASKANDAGGDAPLAPLPHDRVGWKTLASRVRVYLSTLLRFLGETVEDDFSEAIAQQLDRLVPFLYSFPKIAKNALRLLIGVWSERSAAARMRAFLCVHRMAQELPFPFVELCLKQSYLAFVRSSRHVTPRSHSHLLFMRNCVVELCGVDFESTYQMAFVYLRQLAIHLRTAFTKRTQAATQNVTNWQFFMSLSVWAHMLKQYPANEELQHLLYPVTQIISGLINIAKSSRYYPLRFLLCRLLNDMATASAGRLYLNAAPLALEALQCKELMVETRKLRPGNSADVANLFGRSSRLRLAKATLDSRQFQQAVLDQVEEVVIGALSSSALSIAFPDLAVPVLAELRRFKKATPNTPHRQQIAALMKRIDDAVSVVEQARRARAVDFAPKNATKAQTFMETAGIKNSLAEYAETLNKRFEARSAVFVSRDGDNDDGGDDNDDDDDDDDDDNDDDDLGDDDDDDDDAERMSAGKKQNKKRGVDKKSSKAPKKRSKHIDPLIDGDDVLKQFDLKQFSDDEDDE